MLKSSGAVMRAVGGAGDGEGVDVGVLVAEGVGVGGAGDADGVDTGVLELDGLPVLPVHSVTT